MYITEYNSPIGKMLLAAKDEKLCGLWFFGQKYFDENIIKMPFLMMGQIFLNRQKIG